MVDVRIKLPLDRHCLLNLPLNQQVADKTQHQPQEQLRGHHRLLEDQLQETSHATITSSNDPSNIDLQAVDQHDQLSKE